MAIPTDHQAWCELCGYSTEWFAAGMLDRDFVQMQAIEYAQNPDADLEHYKWAAYRYLLAKINWRDHAQFCRFIQIVETDSNEHLYKGAIAELIDSGRVRYAWFMEFPDARFLQQDKIQQQLAAIKPT